MLTAAPLEAHEVGLSRGSYAAAGEGVTAELVLARKEVSSVVPDILGELNDRLSEVLLYFFPTDGLPTMKGRMADSDPEEDRLGGNSVQVHIRFSGSVVIEGIVGGFKNPSIAE
jgi:hypothetical protein